MKWEYLEEDIRGHITVDRLNDRGEDGWELCGVLPADGSVRLVYKRSKPTSVRATDDNV